MGGSSGGSNVDYWHTPLPNQTSGTYSPNQWLSPSGTLDFNYGGMPSSYPMQSLISGMSNIGSMYNTIGQQAPGFYQQAQANLMDTNQNAFSPLTGVYDRALDQQGVTTNNALRQFSASPYISNTIGQQNQIGQGAQDTISSLQQKNVGQVNNLLDNYTNNYIQRLGPQGDLGQQLMGEFNNYGITPSSGAFQDALGKQLGTLGAQNALTLGQQALQPGINAQYNSLGQTLGSQLGTSSLGATAPLNFMQQGLQSQLGTTQQGAGQGGNLASDYGQRYMDLGTQGTLAPLNYENQALTQQMPLLNEIAQSPVDWWNFQNNANYAQAIAAQNAAAQNNAAQMGMWGNIAGSGIGALGTIAAK